MRLSYQSSVSLILLCVILLDGNFSHLVTEQEMSRPTRVRSDTEASVRSKRDTAHVRNKRYSINYINLILNHSNYLRRLQGASNMFKMVWDPYLAEMAGRWVDLCMWKHGYPSGYPYPDGQTHVGESMFATTSSNFNATAVVQYWYNELMYYDYNGPCSNDSVCGTCAAGEECGHYTQLVWWNSRRIGCAFTRCNTLQYSGWTSAATLFMCYYTPPGNYIGEYPYLKGPPCTQCGDDPSRYYCEDELCVEKDNLEETTASKTTKPPEVKTTNKNQITTTRPAETKTTIRDQTTTGPAVPKTTIEHQTTTKLPETKTTAKDQTTTRSAETQTTAKDQTTTRPAETKITNKDQTTIGLAETKTTMKDQTTKPAETKTTNKDQTTAAVSTASTTAAVKEETTAQKSSLIAERTISHTTTNTQTTTRREETTTVSVASQRETTKENHASSEINTVTNINRITEAASVVVHSVTTQNIVTTQKHISSQQQSTTREATTTLRHSDTQAPHSTQTTVRETTVIQTTETPTTGKPLPCGDDTCPNGCGLTSQECCGCKTYNFYRDCTCCPLNYQCCPSSPFFPRGAGCCPTGSNCMGDGSCSFTFQDFTSVFPGRSTTYATTPICPTDPVLVLTGNNFISELFLNGAQVASSMLPNRYYPDILDIVPFPKSTQVIAIHAIKYYGTGEILVRSTDGRLASSSGWKCMDYTPQGPPPDWMEINYDDSEWLDSALNLNYGVVKSGYPYYSLAPKDVMIQWIWTNLQAGPGMDVYCRFTLTAK